MGPAVFMSPLIVILGVHLGITSTLAATWTKMVLLVQGKGESCWTWRTVMLRVSMNIEHFMGSALGSMLAIVSVTGEPSLKLPQPAPVSFEVGHAWWCAGFSTGKEKEYVTPSVVLELSFMTSFPASPAPWVQAATPPPTSMPPALETSVSGIMPSTRPVAIALEMPVRVTMGLHLSVSRRGMLLLNCTVMVLSAQGYSLVCLMPVVESQSSLQMESAWALPGAAYMMGTGAMLRSVSMSCVISAGRMPTPLVKVASELPTLVASMLIVGFDCWLAGLMISKEKT
mmetsp:Transcript_11389/g.28309  ORF Transcript_11389/g.28309 Transcript_11389/m.28309 type:complete len:285 (+) Transcript_11389:1126-1980(+)